MPSRSPVYTQLQVVRTARYGDATTCAKALGIDPKSLVAYERGDRVPDRRMQAKLAAGLGLPWAALARRVPLKATAIVAQPIGCRSALELVRRLTFKHRLEAARAVGVSADVFEGWESGTRPASPAHQKKLAEIFGLPYELLASPAPRFERKSLHA